jgi:sulfur carrier protein ThiS adenylyltransferase
MANNNKLFERNVPGSTAILQKSVVAIAGCGGLGSNAAVSLVRAGIGKLIITDPDIVEESNLNRQYYFLSDIGVKKVKVLTAHLKANNGLSKHGVKLSRKKQLSVPAGFQD